MATPASEAIIKNPLEHGKHDVGFSLSIKVVLKQRWKNVVRNLYLFIYSANAFKFNSTLKEMYAYKKFLKETFK